MQQRSHSTRGILKYLVYCSWPTAAAINLVARVLWLVYCGSCIEAAAVHKLRLPQLAVVGKIQLAAAFMRSLPIVLHRIHHQLEATFKNFYLVWQFLPIHLACIVLCSIAFLFFLDENLKLCQLASLECRHMLCKNILCYMGQKSQVVFIAFYVTDLWPII